MKKIQIVKWSEPMHTSSRIYHRFSIKLPNTPIIDIMLLNNDNKYERIGKATLIENEIELWADNIEYFIDESELNKILIDYHNEFKKDQTEYKYYNELTIGCIGRELNEYKEKNSVELKFLYIHILTKKDIKDILRELKLNSLLV